MNRSDFDFILPSTLIAQSPLTNRSSSRLLCLDVAKGAWYDRQFAHLVELLRPDDLLIFNNTKVLPARLFCVKGSGGRVELLFERQITPTVAQVFIRASKAPKANSVIHLANGVDLWVEGKQDDMYLVRLDSGDWFSLMQSQGELPLPPYITRKPTGDDQNRYQTVFASQPGAVAAPTAGLHFDETVLTELTKKGVTLDYLTLHVGAGTFLPVRADKLQDHKMHTEYYDLPQSVCDNIALTKARGGRVIAVGTTSVRTLESVALHGDLRAKTGATDIFIYPGFEFKVVDAMITNFHLPESTLLMLVSAFASRELILSAYQHAIEEQYRFFSYGDAMFIDRLGDPS